MMLRDVDLRALACVLACAVLSALFFTACGSGHPPLASEDGFGAGVTTPNACGHPNPGCPCRDMGALADCGKVEIQSGTYVACSMGKTTCDGQNWGPCVGDQVTTHALGGGGLHLSNLGTSTSCGSSNPCDPYCQVTVDNSNGIDGGGGLIGTDGGLVIPGADSGGGVTAGGSYYAQPNGTNTCNPNRNVGPGNTCTVGSDEYTQCQQDFHCDGSSGTCAYNGGSGWVDLRCNGIDLTVAAPCDNSGIALFPICNRGLGTVPANTQLNIHYTNPPSVPDGCGPVSGPAECTVTVGANGLGPGQCMDAVGCGPPGDKFVVINAGQVNLTECTTAAGPACKNNAAYGKTAGGQCSQCAAVGSGIVPTPPPPLPVMTFTREYHATCQAQTCVEWEFFSWQAQIPAGTSIDFTAQTSNAAPNGSPASYGPAVPIGSASSTTSTWTSDACTVDGHLQNLAAAKPPLPACAGVDPPQRSEEWLRVNMTFNPSGQSSPVLTTWRQMYDCRPCQ